MSVNSAVTHHSDTQQQTGTQPANAYTSSLREADRLLTVFAETLRMRDVDGQSLIDGGSIRQPEIAVNLNNLADDLRDLAHLQTPERSASLSYSLAPRLQEVLNGLTEMAAYRLHGLQDLPESAEKKEAVIEILHSLASAVRSTGHLAAHGLA